MGGIEGGEDGEYGPGYVVGRSAILMLGLFCVQMRIGTR